MEKQQVEPQMRQPEGNKQNRKLGQMRFVPCWNKCFHKCFLQWVRKSGVSSFFTNIHIFE